MSPPAGSSLHALLGQKMLPPDQKIGLRLIKMISFLNRNDMGMKNPRSSKLAL